MTGLNICKHRVGWSHTDSLMPLFIRGAPHRRCQPRRFAESTQLWSFTTVRATSKGPEKDDGERMMCSWKASCWIDSMDPPTLAVTHLGKWGYEADACVVEPSMKTEIALQQFGIATINFPSAGMVFCLQQAWQLQETYDQSFQSEFGQSGFPPRVRFLVTR